MAYISYNKWQLLLSVKIQLIKLGDLKLQNDGTGANPEYNIEFFDIYNLVLSINDFFILEKTTNPSWLIFINIWIIKI